MDGVVKLVFDQPMDAAKTAAAWSLTGPDGAAIQGKVAWPDDHTLTFTPDKRLESATTYHASLSTQAVTAQGVALQDPLSFQFTTVGDLQVSQVFPAQGTLEVASSAVVTVIFNRPVVPLVIAEEQASLPQPLVISPDVAGKGEWVNTSVYAFRPAQPLKGDTTYALTVLAGLKDATEATSLATDYSWKFTTASPAIDTFELASGRVNPEDYFQNVLLDEAFIIRFLQPMDKASVDSEISLVSSSGQKDPVLTTWNKDLTTVVITPTQRLSLDTDYTFILSTLARSSSGGLLKKGINWNFKTVPYPSIVMTRPGNNALKRCSAGTSSSNSLLRCASTPSKSASSSHPSRKKPSSGGTTIGIGVMVGYFLKPSTRYEVRLLPGMEDIYGNKISKETVVRFTTVAYSPSASLALPYDTPIFRAFGPPESQQFYAYYTNVSRVNLTLASLTSAQFVDFLAGNSSNYQYRPDPTTVIWTK